MSEEESVESWRSFLQDYANGRCDAQDQPEIPLLSPHVLDGDAATPTYGEDFDTPVYTSIEITPAVATRAREFYRKNQFLPPPRAPLETLREQIIQEYDLYSAKQIQNIVAATDLVQAFFGGLCTFTLFKNNVQELMAVSGPKDVIDAIGLFQGKRLLPETSLCGHSVLFSKDNLYIPNLAKDWRYGGNPYADDLKGVKSYVGCVINLNVDPASSSETRVVAVGVINLMHLDDFLPPLRPDQKKVLDHVRRMLETQLMATWEGTGRTREARSRRAVSNYLEHVLVDPSTDPHSHAGGQQLSSNTDSIDFSDSMDDKDLGANEALDAYAHLALKEIKQVLEEMETGMTVDLRDMISTKTSSGDRLYTMNSDQPARLPVLGHLGIATKSIPPEMVIDHFDRYRALRSVSYDSSTVKSGFESLLPASTTSHVVLPFALANGQPVFLLIVSSSRRFYTFRSSECNFLRSMGVVLRARIAHSKVIEADAAKTAFLSSIRHELRTPMHGLLSGLQLIHQAMVNEDYEQVKNLLALAESSGYALQQILNDVLDFGSLAQGKSTPRVVGTDLRTTTIGAAKTCWMRSPASEGLRQVNMRIEVEDRDWKASVDEAGFQRILFNGLTNAIKFTTQGSITVSLSSSPDNKNCRIQITDTGPGIDPQFQAKMFEPFTKADSFSPGAGLGLYITKLLASRMGGAVSLTSLPKGGAMFEAIVPVTFTSDRPEFVPIVITEIIAAPKTASLSHELQSMSLERTLSDEDIPLTPDDTLRILIADDNPIGIKILSALLNQISRREHITMAVAKDGVEAVEQFMEFSPHLVLTDVSMPRMDGIAAAGEMRNLEKTMNRPRSTIVAITGLGSSDPRLRLDALKGSAVLDGWLIKGQDKLTKIKDIIKKVRQEQAALK